MSASLRKRPRCCVAARLRDGPLPDLCAATKSGQCRDCGSGIQLIEQPLSLLEIARVETFGKPAADRSEKIAGLIPLALIAPEPREAEGRTQLPEFGALPPRDCECATVAFLRCGVLMYGQQQRASQPMQFSLGPPRLCRLDQLGGLGQPIEPFVRLPRHPIDLRERHEKK